MGQSALRPTRHRSTLDGTRNVLFSNATAASTCNNTLAAPGETNPVTRVMGFMAKAHLRRLELRPTRDGSTLDGLKTVLVSIVTAVSAYGTSELARGETALVTLVMVASTADGAPRWLRSLAGA